MLNEIEFSFISYGDNAAEEIRAVLAPFEAASQMRVNLRLMPDWEQAWTEVVKVAQYSQGPDVSLIGTTWVGNLVAMNSLRSFVQSDIDACGGAQAFIPASWHSCLLSGSSTVWAMPYMADIRLIYYRRDLLAQAGVDEATAFTTPEQMVQTLECLQRSLAAEPRLAPWAMPTRRALGALHNVSCWLWGAGGDFISADGRQVLFSQPAALAGLRAYFDLRRFLTPETSHLNEGEVSRMFREGRAAAILGGLWVWLGGLARLQSAAPEVLANIGFALPPGVPFVGGGNLVIWRHAHNFEQALSLIRYLTSVTVQTKMARQAGFLPVVREAIMSAELAEEPLIKTLLQAIETGRAFTSLPAWGLVEDKLAMALAEMWNTLLQDSTLSFDEAAAKYLEPLARRLNYTLSSRQ